LTLGPFLKYAALYKELDASQDLWGSIVMSICSITELRFTFHCTVSRKDLVTLEWVSASDKGEFLYVTKSGDAKRTLGGTECGGGQDVG
jgi:hypothetical protein